MVIHGYHHGHPRRAVLLASTREQSSPRRAVVFTAAMPTASSLSHTAACATTFTTEYGGDHVAVRQCPRAEACRGATEGSLKGLRVGLADSVTRLRALLAPTLHQWERGDAARPSGAPWSAGAPAAVEPPPPPQEHRVLWSAVSCVWSAVGCDNKKKYEDEGGNGVSVIRLSVRRDAVPPAVPQFLARE